MKGMPKVAVLLSYYFLLIVILVPERQLVVRSMSHSSSSSSSSSSDMPKKTNSNPHPTIQYAPNGDIVWKEDDEEEKKTVYMVPTQMNYVTSDTIDPKIVRDSTGSDSGIQNCRWDSVTVHVKNARCSTTKLTLDDNGLELIENAPFALLDSNTINFLDSHQVLNEYYPHCEQLLYQRLKQPNNNVALVQAFDHNIRMSQNKNNNNNNNNNNSAKSNTHVQPSIGIVHGDYTQQSGPKRLMDLSQPPKINDVYKDMLTSSSSSLLDPSLVKEAMEGKRRFAFINVWRNIDTEHPVSEHPLACIDSTTVSEHDLRIFKIHYPDRIGQNYFTIHNPNHCWYYYSKMIHSEALLIKQWDSFGDLATTTTTGTNNVVSTMAIHSAFADPSTSLNTIPRKSIEVRCVVIWEKES